MARRSFKEENDPQALKLIREIVEMEDPAGEDIALLIYNQLKETGCLIDTEQPTQRGSLQTERPSPHEFSRMEDF